MVEYDDEALARMRAADPATGSYPDQALLRRKLAGRTPLGAPGAAGTDDDAVAVRVHDRTTRGSRPTLVAAATVTALALGAGGYAVGLQAADGGGQGGETVAGQPGEVETGEADASADDGPAARVPDEPAMETGEADAPYLGDSDSGAGEAQGGDVDMASSYAGSGSTILTAGPGLSTGTGSGEVEILRPPEDLDQEAFLTSWAQALGLEGEPVQLDELTTTFTSGAESLTVTLGAYSQFDYTHPGRAPYCTEDDAQAAEEAARDTEPGPTTLPAPVACADPGDPPSKEEAVAQAREFLTTTGLDLRDYGYTAESFDGEPYVQVTGRPGDGGPSTSVNVIVTGAGVANATGTLGEYVSLGDYPVISEVEAVNRFNDARFGNQGWVWIPETSATVMDEPLPSPDVMLDAPAFDPAPGEALPFPTSEATIVEATLEQGVMNLPDGTELLVPAYDLVDEDGRHYPMLAVADEALDFSPGD